MTNACPARARLFIILPFFLSWLNGGVCLCVGIAENHFNQQNVHIFAENEQPMYTCSILSHRWYEMSSDNAIGLGQLYSSFLIQRHDHIWLLTISTEFQLDQRAKSILIIVKSSCEQVMHIRHIVCRVTYVPHRKYDSFENPVVFRVARLPMK